MVAKTPEGLHLDSQTGSRERIGNGPAPAMHFL